jgi:hypothetical protein
MAATPEETEIDESPSMDETIREDYREITARLTAEDSAEPEAVAPINAPDKAESRPRGEDGKFIKAEAPAAEPTSAAPETASQPLNPEVTAPAAAEAEPAPTLPDGRPIDLTRPPSSFKPAAKAAWAQVPDAVKADIYRRETEHHQGYRGIKEQADFGASMKSTIEPYRMLIESEGGTPERAVAELLRTAALFRTGTMQQKQAAIQQIARQYGIEPPQAPALDANGQPVQQPQQPVYQDPRVDQLLSYQQRQEQERQQIEDAKANDATTRFLETKGADGQPAYPFVDNVMQDMISRTAEIRRTNPALSHDDVLKKAYEAAVWANPETRAVLMAQEQAKAQQPAETLRKVEEAKRANANNLPKRGALPAQSPKGSMEDTIRDTYRELTANL